MCLAADAYSIGAGVPAGGFEVFNQEVYSAATLIGIYYVYVARDSNNLVGFWARYHEEAGTQTPTVRNQAKGDYTSQEAGIGAPVRLGTTQTATTVGTHQAGITPYRTIPGMSFTITEPSIVYAEVTGGTIASSVERSESYFRWLVGTTLLGPRVIIGNTDSTTGANNAFADKLNRFLIVTQASTLSLIHI